MNGREEITWRLHLRSPPEVVYSMFSTDEGRERFWAEKSFEENGNLDLRFIDGQTLACKILERVPAEKFVFEYFGGSVVAVALNDDGSGGTDLVLNARRVKYAEEWPGWVSVLLALKTATDFSVDVRNHDPKRTWEQGYCDN